MKALLISEYEVKVVESKKGESNLDFMYRNIGCDCIDIPRRKVGGKTFEIVCDDEGLLKDNPRVSAIGKNNEVMLVGNLLIFSGVTPGGDLIDITSEDVKTIKKNLCLTLDESGFHPVIRNMDY